MSAGIFDITTSCNVDFELNIQYTDYNDAVIDLSGKKCVFSVKRTYLSIYGDVFSIHSSVGDTVEGTLEFPNTENAYGSITLNSPATGDIKLTIDKDTLTYLTPGQYFYSLKLVGITTEVILRGKFDIEGF